MEHIRMVRHPSKNPAGHGKTMGTSHRRIQSCQGMRICRLVARKLKMKMSKTSLSLGACHLSVVEVHDAGGSSSNFDHQSEEDHVHCPAGR